MPKKPKAYSIHGKPMGRKPKPPGSPKGPPPAKPFPKGVVQNPNGRPSTFTEELGERVLELLWSGRCKTLYDVEKQDGIPSRQTLYTWKRNNPEWAAKLEAAQEAIGEVYAAEIDKVVEDVLAGKVDPSAGNVAIRSKQWKAASANARTYGNKSYEEKKHTVNITSQHINRIDINGLDDEQMDAIEAALNARLLPGPDGDVYTTGED